MFPYRHNVLCLCSNPLAEGTCRENVFGVSTGGQESSWASGKATTLYSKGLMGHKIAIKIETMWLKRRETHDMCCRKKVKTLHVHDGARSWSQDERVQRNRLSLSVLPQMKLKARKEKMGSS